MEIIKKTLVVLVLCSFIVGTIPISVLAEQNGPDDQIFEHEGPSLSEGVEYAQGEIIVKFKPWVSNRGIANINSIHGTSVKYTSPYAGFKVLHVPKGKSVPDMVEIFSKNKNVEYAELNYIASALMVPNDPYYHLQWHFDNDGPGGINMEEAWESSSGAGVIVAVLDTGVAYENYRDGTRSYAQAPDLAGTTFVLGRDFVNNDIHPNDDDGHGTHVTGTIAQTTNNGMGVAGIAYNAHIMPVKVLDNSGSGYYSWIADGIYYAARNGAQVISMSLGGESSSPTLESALEYAHNEGVVIVAAAGNGGKDDIIYPAAYDDYVIAVGATRYDETRAYYSSYSDNIDDPTIQYYVDIAAPGGDVYIDQNGDGYGDGVLQQTLRPHSTTRFGYYFYQGTSMATPHISGVAALLISEGIATTPDEVREAIQSTAEDKGSDGWDPEYGWGIVDAHAALQWSATPNNPPVANDQSVTIDEDTPVAITLTATDPDGDTLTYSILSGPLNGVLTGTAPTLTYTPNTDYNGADSFTFKVNDGTADSNTATVNITVTEAPTSPTMHIDSINMSNDTKSAGPNVFTWALATVTIVDSSNNPVSGAQITGTWSNLTSDSDTAPTETDGEVTVCSDRIKNLASGTFTFTVDDVMHSDFTYNATANVETSNSTSVN
jgi:serine protease